MVSKRYNYTFIFYYFLLSLISYSSSSQNIDSNLIGTWQFSRLDLLQSKEDSLEISKEWMSVMLTLEHGNKFKTRRKLNNSTVIIATGNYYISPDNKNLFQDGIRSEIVELTDKKLALKLELGVILHFTRISTKQTSYTGRVINNKTNQPVSYASISLIKANKGTNTDENGNFIVPIKEQRHDTLIISCVGYENLKVPIDELPTNLLFRLIEKVATLKEVIVYNIKNVKSITLNKFTGIGFDRLSISDYLTQIAQPLYTLEKNALLTEVHIYKSQEKALFRVRIYDIDSITQKPSYDLCDTVIEINSTKNHVQIDMTKYNIRIPGNTFYVAIEWLKIPYNEYQFTTSFQGRKNVATGYHPSIILGKKITNTNQIPWSKNHTGTWQKFDLLNDVLRIAATVKY